MTFDIGDEDGVKVVRLHGEMVGRHADLVEAITSLLASPGARVLLDLADVPFMNSTGLSQLVRVTAQANIQEGRIVLTNLSPFVSGVLQTSRLDRFFEIAGTVEEALQILQ